MKPKLTTLLLAASLTTAASAQISLEWSKPEPVVALNSTALERDPAPTQDGLSIYFCSTRTGDWQIFRAPRTGPYGTFGPPVRLIELASAGSDTEPCPRADDLEIFFASTRAGGFGGGDLWRATRASTALPFAPPTVVWELSTALSESSPSLSADGLRIWFSSNRPGGIGSDIYTATRPSRNMPFTAPVPVTELNTFATEAGPHVASDGLTIFFTSNRLGGLGDLDTWMATRLDPGSPFTNLVNMGALNSPAADESPGFATFPDEIFFASARPVRWGTTHIWRARKPGVFGNGLAGRFSARDLRFSDPASPGLPYAAGSALWTTPGIPIDKRVIPLNFDPLFAISAGGLPPVLTGYTGVLNGDGIAAGKISFANLPEFVGFRFFTAFLVLDPASPSGIKTISDAHEVLVQ